MTKSSEEITARLMEARARSLRGRSPREVGRQKILNCLEWTNLWGWSSPAVLDILSLTARRGIAARLEGLGLVKSSIPAGAGGVPQVPGKCLTITKAGMDLLSESTAAEWREVEAFRRKIPAQTLRHEHILQLILARFWARTIGDEKEKYRPYKILGGSALAALSKRGVKQPDSEIRFVIDEGNELIVDVELELTGKWSTQLETTIAAQLQSKSHAIFVISPNPALLRRYEKDYRPGRKLQLWEPDQAGRLKRAGVLEINWGKKEINFIHLNLATMTLSPFRSINPGAALQVLTT